MFLYKYGGADKGERANYGIGNALQDTGVGTAQFGYNSVAGINNVFYGALARVNLQYFTTGHSKAPRT